MDAGDHRGADDGGGLLQREDELARLAGAVEAVRGGEGALVLLAGPAGIGKTALLRHARREATAAGLRVLGAAASDLDRDFPFGLVHQLLDGVLAGADAQRRARLLSGAAARAEAVLAPAGDAELPADPGHAVLHGLFWLVANLAEEGPLALLVDDLHWADRASLRLLEVLARRLDALPVLVVGTLRPQEPGAETELLLALEAAAAARVVRPRALDAPAVAGVLARALGGEPEPGFAEAAAAATGGNPLLLRVLAAEAAERGLRGAAGEAGALAGLAATGLAVVVRRRLVALGRDALALAHAAAVLGEPARLDDLAAVAELDAAAARVAADRLAAAEVLDAPGWGFVHPVVRAAVAEALAPGERARLHLLAARRLRATGAVAGRVAVHLLAAEPAGSAEAVATLRAAARAAAAEGAPEAGVLHLRRALEEPPSPAERPGLLLELGELEARAADPRAFDRLTAALDAGLTGDEAARAHAARSALQLHREPVLVLDDLSAALAEAAAPALRTALEARLLEASVFHVALVARRAELLRAGRAAPAPSPVMLAHLAQEGAFGAALPAQVVADAEGATAGDALLRAVGPANSTFNLLVHALRAAERPDEARGLLDRGEALARREGVRFADFFLAHATGYWHWDYGSIAAGLAQASTGLDEVRSGGFDATAPALIAIVAELLVEADRLDEAAAVVDELRPGGEDLVGGPFALAARGVVHRRRHRRGEAEVDLREAVAGFDRRGWAHAASAPRLHLAEVLGERGEREEALEVARRAHGDLAGAGRAWAAAAALRVEGLVTGGERGLELLAAAAEALAGSAQRRQHGWALLELGAALRRAGRRGDARAPLRAALDVAVRIESARLARVGREELAAAGGRVLREQLSGPAALTPSERRVADLALRGLTNREIAETLWVTRKTVELHLGSAYGKLGIRSRTQLPDVLGPPPAGAVAA